MQQSFTPTPFDERIVKAVEYLRYEHHLRLNYRDTMALIGLTSSHYNQVKHRRRGVPKQYIDKAIAELSALGINAQWLRNGVGSMVLKPTVNYVAEEETVYDTPLEAMKRDLAIMQRLVENLREELSMKNELLTSRRSETRLLKSQLALYQDRFGNIGPSEEA